MAITCMVSCPFLGKFAAQLIAHQRPDLLDGVLPGNLAAQLGVEVLGLAQADSPVTVKPLRRTRTQKVSKDSAGVLPARAGRSAVRPHTILRGEIVFACDVRLDVIRCDPGRGSPPWMHFSISSEIPISAPYQATVKPLGRAMLRCTSMDTKASNLPAVSAAVPTR